MFDRCTLDDVAAALCHIHADERGTWVRMGMAVHHEFGPEGFDTWDAWSQTAGNYNASAARDTYKSFKAKGGGITIATLFEEAMKAGYSPEKKQLTEAEQQQREAAREAREQARLLREAAETDLEQRWHGVIAAAAAEVWAGLAAGGKSPYLGRKKIKPFGARFVPHGIVVAFGPEDEPAVELITGREQITEFFALRDKDRALRYLKPGCLVVPLFDIGGALGNLQIIYPSGEKSFLKHGPKAGLSYQLGDIAPASPIVFVEGFATGASVHIATGYPVVVALDAGNLPVVANAYAGLYSREQHAFVIAGDNDVYTAGNPGLKKARQAANDVGGIVVVPTFGAVAHG